MALLTELRCFISSMWLSHASL